MHSVCAIHFLHSWIIYTYYNNTPQNKKKPGKGKEHTHIYTDTNRVIKQFVTSRFPTNYIVPTYWSASFPDDYLLAYNSAPQKS